MIVVDRLNIIFNTHKTDINLNNNNNIIINDNNNMTCTVLYYNIAVKTRSANYYTRCCFHGVSLQLLLFLLLIFLFCLCQRFIILLKIIFVIESMVLLHNLHFKIPMLYILHGVSDTADTKRFKSSYVRIQYCTIYIYILV